MFSPDGGDKPNDTASLLISKNPLPLEGGVDTDDTASIHLLVRGTLEPLEPSEPFPPGAGITRFAGDVHGEVCR